MELSQSDEKWEAWKKKDNDSYALFCFAGRAAQIEFAGSATESDAKADYSFVEYRLHYCFLRRRVGRGGSTFGKGLLACCAGSRTGIALALEAYAQRSRRDNQALYAARLTAEEEFLTSAITGAAG